MQRRQFQPGELCHMARLQADRARARGGKVKRIHTPRDLSYNQLHDVERLLPIHGLKRRHIALMCDTSVRLINRYFPRAEFPELPAYW